MGNYLTSLPSINNVYQLENNNKVNTNIAVHVEEPKIPKISNCLNVSAALTVNKLHHECKKDSSVITKIWNTLYNFYNKPRSPCTTNLLDESVKINSLRESVQSVASTKKNFWIKEREVESDFCISFSKSPTACNSSLLAKNNQTICGTSPCERSLENERKEESGDIENLILDSKRYQKLQVQDYNKQLPDQPFRKLTFQRLDSGIEEPPYPYKTDSVHLKDRCLENLPHSFRTLTKIDLDSLYMRTIGMGDSNQRCPLSEHLIIGTETTQGFHKSISFFIDIRDPLKQKPLRDEYKFLACGEMFSGECDSMFSDKCSESSNEDCIDDFIVFEESSSDDEDSYGFNLTLNACSTPVELSCSVSANSTVGTYVDVPLNTLPYGDTNCDKSPKKSATSVKIDILSSTGNQNSQRLSNCAVFQDYTFPDTTECTTFPASDIRTEKTRPFDICFTNKKKRDTSTNSNFFSFGDCTPEATTKEACCMLKTNVLDPSTKKKSRKKVCFVKDEDLVVVYQMRHWDFAYREARKGTWELAAVDRCRFWRRIKDLESLLSPCLKRKLELIKNT